MTGQKNMPYLAKPNLGLPSRAVPNFSEPQLATCKKAYQID